MWTCILCSLATSIQERTSEVDKSFLYKTFLFSKSIIRFPLPNIPNLALISEHIFFVIGYVFPVQTTKFMLCLCKSSNALKLLENIKLFLSIIVPSKSLATNLIIFLPSTNNYSINGNNFQFLGNTNITKIIKKQKMLLKNLATNSKIFMMKDTREENGKNGKWKRHWRYDK